MVVVSEDDRGGVVLWGFLEDFSGIGVARSHTTKLNF
jgi:hypothetical protein